jgi:GNAT superfamily N-acetyltransferase
MSPGHGAPEAMKEEIWQGRLRDGNAVLVRPVQPQDATLERDFLGRLPPEVMAHCFLGLIRPRDEQLANELAALDGQREFGILALAMDHGNEVVIGTARYRLDESGEHCDCAVAVDPAWRQRGVGSILMSHLIGVARMRGIRTMYAIDAARCAGAHALASYLGFRSCPDPQDPASITFELTLQP